MSKQKQLVIAIPLIALILAIAAIIRPIKIEPRTLKQDIPFLIFTVVILYVLIMDYSLGVGNGLFLCALLILFFIAVVLREIKTKKNACVTARGSLAPKKVAGVSSTAYIAHEARTPPQNVRQ